MSQKTRHILSLSGGKDSAALAVYMRDKVPDMEYVFCDTHKELRETYDYLLKIEALLGKPVIRLSAHRGFDHWLKMFGGYLPSPRARWCTKMLKLKPFEKYVGSEDVVSYVGLRADEDREGYISHRPSIHTRYPFREDGIVLHDIYEILQEAGIGLPEYYRWRSRSGCFFCFFQRKVEWVGLLKNHPGLFEEAKEYEKLSTEPGKRFTWSERETLEELSQPKRVAEIEREHQKAVERARARQPNRTLAQVFGAEELEEPFERPCIICDL